MRLLATLLCGSLLSSSCALAQMVDPDKFRAFIASPLHEGLISRAISGVPKDILPTCPELKTPPATITLSRPIAFGPDGAPVAGAWWESLPVAGCGNDTILNIYFDVSPESAKINTVMAAPGATHASILLQRDALQYALAALHMKIPGCNYMQIRNTRFEGYGLKNPPTANPGPEAKFHPWWETWTFAACNRTYDVPMDFAPDDTGTRIIQPGAIVEK